MALVLEQISLHYYTWYRYVDDTSGWAQATWRCDFPAAGVYCELTQLPSLEWAGSFRMTDLSTNVPLSQFGKVSYGTMDDADRDLFEVVFPKYVDAVTAAWVAIRP